MADARGDLAEIKQLLQSQVDSLVRTLAPDGRRSGKYWIARNPARDDRRAGSFWVMLSGAPGAWRDEATGEKGDILDLVRYCGRLANRRDALAWARDWLGIASMPREVLQRQIAVAQKRAAESDAARAAALERERRRAFAVWLKASPQLIGTVADTYLQGRGIMLAALPKLPGALRFDGHHNHHESGLAWPCLMAAMFDGGPHPVAIHRTWLERDGSGKAPVEPARKIWPSFRGCFIPLARGETGLPPAEAAKHGLIDTLVLCEGVEDGLSVAIACPQYRVWAAGSLGNLQSIKLPACCGEVIVAADNDWGKPQAQKQLDKGLDALSSQGRPLRVARSPIGKDINDALRGAA